MIFTGISSFRYWMFYKANRCTDVQRFLHIRKALPLTIAKGYSGFCTKGYSGFSIPPLAIIKKILYNILYDTERGEKKDEVSI